MVKPWYSKLMKGSDSTAIFYAYHLQRLLEKRKETPTQFLAHCKSMKADLGGLWQELRDQAFEFPTGSIKMEIKSFRSFLQHHGVFLPSERISIRSEGDVKELTLGQIREIINHCPEPYKTIYTIFTFAPMGEVSFIKWNNRPDMAKDVKAQLATKKPYVKVIHPPRKNAKRKFYSLIPRDVIEAYLRKRGRLPFTNTGGKLLQDYNLQSEWRRARARAGLTDMKGVGCHEIRDAWFTYAGTQGVEWDVRKFTIGHSQFSEQGYNKLWANEDYVWKQLSKSQGVALTESDLQERDQTIQNLQAQIDELKKGKGFSEEDVARMVEQYLSKR